ncbi:MAG: GlcNAc deacetylase, Carbohydrate Esterase Family 4-like protein [Rubritepida sp.]|nr:GlcNAc deacetylase, Carbohydrate Esterase Family 4-like protein [Rubritepida sp.]
MRASLLAHGAGAALLAGAPQLWPQVLGALALNHAVLTCGMHPRSAMLGRNLTRLPAGHGACVALTFDDGPDPEVTPQVLDLLDAHGAKASFFVLGSRAERHPALLREMLGRGHGVENHTHDHPFGFACMGPVAQWREVRRAQEAIAAACGQAPRYFRAPMGLRNPLLDPALAAEQLSLVSWTRRGLDTRPGPPEQVLARLTGGLAAGDILLMHDGSTVRGRGARSTGRRPPVLDVLPGLLHRISALGLTAIALPPPGDA